VHEKAAKVQGALVQEKRGEAKAAAKVTVPPKSGESARKNLARALLGESEKSPAQGKAVGKVLQDKNVNPPRSIRQAEQVAAARRPENEALLKSVNQVVVVAAAEVEVVLVARSQSKDIADPSPEDLAVANLQAVVEEVKDRADLKD
jgi:hypothetical protein